MRSQLPNACIIEGDVRRGMETAHVLLAPYLKSNGSKINLEDNCDVCILAPEKNSISIEQVRQGIEFLQTYGHCGERFLVIQQAQLMTPNASDALLKTLEEMRFVILLANSRVALSKTIQSRCMVYPAGYGLGADEDTTKKDRFWLELASPMTKRSVKLRNLSEYIARDIHGAIVSLQLSASKLIDGAQDRGEATSMLERTIELLSNARLYALDTKLIAPVILLNFASVLMHN